MEHSKMTELTAEELDTISAALMERSIELKFELEETIHGLRKEMDGSEYDSMWIEDSIEVASNLFEQVKKYTILSLRTKFATLTWKDGTAE